MLKKKINSVEEKIALKVEEKVEVVEKKMEEEIEKVKEQVEERIEEVEGNFSQQVEDFEKKLLAWGKMNKNKFMLASPLSTYDGKTNWEVYKTQFCIISVANG
ncbi:hypothetical protein TNCV_2105271 [Trichonephila clavipes]|nr:hypothetical protein TNCV_2105271 [Trichonephila clavipes]